jgi:hypothetical protein
MTKLQSRAGELKSVEEWQQDCKVFYSHLKLNKTPQDFWERYKRVLGLQPEGIREWDGRKPQRSNGATNGKDFAID